MLREVLIFNGEYHCPGTKVPGTVNLDTGNKSRQGINQSQTQELIEDMQYIYGVKLMSLLTEADFTLPPLVLASTTSFP